MPAGQATVLAPAPTGRVAGLHSLRESGLTALTVISLVPIVVYLIFLAIDCGRSACEGRVWPRSVLISLHLAMLAAVRCFPRYAVEHYGQVIGTLAFLLMVATALLTPLLFTGDGGLSASPTLLIALFILYVFIRLPALTLVGIGLSASLIGFVQGVRLPFVDDVDIRTAINLAMVNALGYALARSVEQREDKLLIEQQRAEHHGAELRARTIAAEQAIADKNRFMAAIGHDLRQPLMAAHLHGELLKLRLDNDDLAGSQREVRELADGLAQLKFTIDQLLMAARDESVEIGEQADVGVESMLRRAGWVFEDECRRRGLTLRVRVADPTLMVRTHSDALFRILVNLLGNAVKFSRPAPAPGQTSVRGIVLQALARGDRVLIRVIDNGIGMAPEDLERIWEAFYQSGSAISQHREGLGLGLYLVRRSLDRLPSHGISLRSSRRLGTRFTLSVPRAWPDDDGNLIA